ncbi:MAG: DUF456 domain-containing protein [bacterium]
MPWTFLAHALAFVLMAAGLVGVVLPYFPGIPLIWFGVFCSAVVTRFETIDVPFLALVGTLAILSYLPEYWSTRWGIKKEIKVTPFGVLGGVLGSFIGLFFGIVPALTIGPLLGSVFGEMVTGRESVFVLETEAHTIVGFIGSSLVKVTMGIMIIGLWFVKIIQ